MMQRIVIFISVVLIFSACSAPQKVSNKEKNNTNLEAEVDADTEYGIEMFDAKFEAWYKKYRNAATSREQAYYESWNKQYVSMWNNKANSSVGKFPFDPVVGFEPTEDYGYDLNHKLFHYFMYVEKVLKIKIMPGGPNFILL